MNEFHDSKTHHPHLIPPMRNNMPTQSTGNEPEDDLSLAVLYPPSALAITIEDAVPPTKGQRENRDVERKRNLNELTGSSIHLPQQRVAKNVGGRIHTKGW